MINKELLKDIDAFVKLNELGDLKTYINTLLKNAFMRDKYLSSPKNNAEEILATILTEEINKVAEDEQKIKTNEIKSQDDIYNE